MADKDFGPHLLGRVRMEQALLAVGASALWGAATVAGRPLSVILPPMLLAGARFALALPVLALLAMFLRAAAAGGPDAGNRGLAALDSADAGSGGHRTVLLGAARDDGFDGDSGGTLLSSDFAADRSRGAAHADHRRAMGGLALLLAAVVALGRRPEAVQVLPREDCRPGRVS